MSEKNKPSAQPPAGFPLPDPAQWREAYGQFWQQSAAQWDQFLRDPLFLSAMGTFLEQTQNQTALAQQMAGGTLRMMNLPTHEDFQELIQSIEGLREQMAELCQRLDRLAPEKGRDAKAARRSTVKRARKRA